MFQAKREGSSFLHAIYAKKNNNSLDNKFKQIYDLNLLLACNAVTQREGLPHRRAGEPEACITSLARKIIEAKALQRPVFYKHFPPAIKEWNNSIFTYNPNLTVSLTVIDKMVIKIIKSYFNLYVHRGISQNDRKNHRQLRVNKAYFSKLTVKHTNSKVTITVYLYANFYKDLYFQYKHLNNGSLANLLANYYNKKVVIRVIRLRYLQLNSNILVEYLARGLAIRRINPLKELRRALKKAKRPNILNTNLIKEVSTSYAPSQRLLEYSSYLQRLGDISDLTLAKYKKNEMVNEQELKKTILNSIKYKSLAGIKIKISGRLNRRAVAARSVVKSGQLGSLKNFDSYEGLSAVVLRGHQRPNVEIASFNYKTRNGAFNAKA